MLVDLQFNISLTKCRVEIIYLLLVCGFDCYNSASFCFSYQYYVNCGHTNEMKMWASQLSNYKLSLKNVFGASTGFEPVASALALQCSTNWAMKTNMLGAGQFIELFYWVIYRTRERNETYQYYVNCGHTNEIKMWSSQLCFISFCMSKESETLDALLWFNLSSYNMTVEQTSLVYHNIIQYQCSVHF